MHLVEIEIDRGFGPHAAGTEAALEHLLDGSRETQLGCALQLLAGLRGSGRAGRLAGPGEQVAAAVDHGDVLRPQTGTAAEIRLRIDLHAFTVEPGGAGHGEDDACLRFLPLAGERFAPR